MAITIDAIINWLNKSLSGETVSTDFRVYESQIETALLRGGAVAVKVTGRGFDGDCDFVVTGKRIRVTASISVQHDRYICVGAGPFAAEDYAAIEAPF